MELLKAEELPEWFQYPAIFLTVINQGLVDFHPWHVIPREAALVRLNGLRRRYPNRHIVPFAQRTDCDDVACFDRLLPGGVLVLHDFAQSGWEKPRTYGSFKDWVRAAIEDMLSFEPEGAVWTRSK